MKIKTKIGKMPRVLIVIAIVVVAVVGFILLRGGANENYRDLSLEDSPYVTLTPRSDGHWLKLTMENFAIDGAKTVEYELIYEVPGGVTQGVPGKVEIGSEGKVERDLLLGSESAGKFRYDEDVTEGTLGIKFKSGSGKILAELTTPWKMLQGVEELSLDRFSYKLDSKSDDEYLVVVNTFGLPKALTGATGEPYGVFASGGEPYPGIVTLGTKISRFDGVDWRTVDDQKSPNIGTFVEVSK